MLSRKLAPLILKWSNQYPIVTVTGPRQSGKTTLVRSLFPRYDYISLEDLDHRQFASEDPRGFLKQFKKGVILDEFQNVPDLPSYLQTEVDQNSTPGRFILTGSQQFELMKKVGQSLAGRTAIARLLPLSIEELYPTSSLKDLSLNKVLYQGFYPRIFDQKLNPTEALSFYLSAYLEKDVRQLLKVVDFTLFERFLKILAGRTGQLLNSSALGGEIGVSHNTIRSWISILEASYIIKLLPPWSSNYSKRIVKTPKIYFIDTGLAACLWGIQNASQLDIHPLRGALFETLILSEFWKSIYHSGTEIPLYFYRDHQGLESDLLWETTRGLTLLEIKSSQTIHSDFFKSFESIQSVLKNVNRTLLIYGGIEPSYFRQKTELSSWTEISKIKILT